MERVTGKHWAGPFNVENVGWQNTMAMPRSSAAAIASSSRRCRGLDHGDRAVFRDDVEAIAKRKERVRGGHRIGQVERRLRLSAIRAESTRLIWPAPMPVRPPPQ
jgi:hypothetical protein